MLQIPLKPETLGNASPQILIPSTHLWPKPSITHQIIGQNQIRGYKVNPTATTSQKIFETNLDFGYYRVAHRKLLIKPPLVKFAKLFFCFFQNNMAVQCPRIHFNREYGLLFIFIFKNICNLWLRSLTNCFITRHF